MSRAASGGPVLEMPKPGGEREKSYRILLEQFFEITRLLDRLERVEATLPALLAITAKAIPICTAVLIEKRRGRPRAWMWHTPDRSPRSVLAARTHALAEYSYLAGAADPLVNPEIIDLSPERLVRPASEAETSGHYIVLPLVVDSLPIFGALLIELTAPPDVLSLAFINAIANLLSVALDRYYSGIEQAALLAETAKDYAIFMLDPEGNVSSWNAGAERVNGYAAEEIIGKHLSLLYPSEDARTKVSTELDEAAKQGRIVEEGWRIRKDGSHFWASSVTTALRGAGGGVVGFARATQDLTERRKVAETLQNAEREVRDHAKQLEEAVADLEAFSHTVSHNLRGPLRAVQGYAFYVLNNVGEKLDPDSRQMLDRLSRATLRMDRLIQDLLSYSKIKGGEYLMSPIDLDPLVAHIIEDYPGREQAEIRCMAPLGTVMGQESLLMLALSNLIENAIKFMPAGRKPVVEIWSETDGRRRRVNVRDNGIGIADEYHEKIFQPFSRLNTAEKYEGTGIGLTIVRKAVERMGGRVGLASKAGEGSRFWIEVPAAI